MKISYPNAYRLWSSLHRGNPLTLFLVTSEKPPLGQSVPVELALPGKAHTLQFTAEVVERRGGGGRFPAGVMVKLTETQLLAIRQYLGIGPVSIPAAPRVEARDGRPAHATVVLGDDDPDILAFLVRALARFNVGVVSVADGSSALRAIQELKPNLVVLDVVMPGLDGTEVCRAMRSDERLCNIPVILVSALNKDELDDVADQAGANDCLAKPVDLGVLLNVVGSYLVPGDGKVDRASL